MKKLFTALLIVSSIYLASADAPYVVNVLGGLGFLFTCISIGTKLAERSVNHG